jgi:hypothetical protein
VTRAALPSTKRALSEQRRSLPLRMRACRRPSGIVAHWTEAVAQTAEGVTGSVLSVGSKDLKVVARPRRARLPSAPSAPSATVTATGAQVFADGFARQPRRRARAPTSRPGLSDRAFASVSGTVLQTPGPDDQQERKTVVTSDGLPDSRRNQRGLPSYAGFGVSTSIGSCLSRRAPTAAIRHGCAASSVSSMRQCCVNDVSTDLSPLRTVVVVRSST